MQDNGKDAMKYSVIIPVFNSARTVREVVDRVVGYFQNNQFDYEIILINDGSSDESWSIISNLSVADSRIIAIDLVRNYGQHSANLCGFRHATGDYIITLDDDLQNPPEEIDKLIHAVKRGNDLVVGEFQTKKHSLIRRLGSKVVGALNQRIFHKPPNLVMSNFRIIHRSIIDKVNLFSGINPYIPGLVVSYATNPANVSVQHHSRQVGKSNYGLKRLLKLVFVLSFNYSTYPLRVLVSFGAIVASLSFLLGGYLMIRFLILDIQVPGWTSIVTLMSFFFGFVILLLGVLGEYIIYLVRQANRTPQYLIREVLKA